MAHQPAEPSAANSASTAADQAPVLPTIPSARSGPGRPGRPPGRRGPERVVGGADEGVLQAALNPLALRRVGPGDVRHRLRQADGEGQVHPVHRVPDGGVAGAGRVRPPAGLVAGAELERLAQVVAEPPGEQHVPVDPQRPDHRLQGVGHPQGHAGDAAQVLGLGALLERRRPRPARPRDGLDGRVLRLRQGQRPGLDDFAPQLLVRDLAELRGEAPVHARPQRFHAHHRLSSRSPGPSGVAVAPAGHGRATPKARAAAPDGDGSERCRPLSADGVAPRPRPRMAAEPGPQWTRRVVRRAHLR